MINLDFEFKGERNYIQGGDIFNGVEGLAREMFSDGFVSLLVFRNLTRRHCVLAFESQTSMQVVATGNISTADGQRHGFWLYERDEEVIGRYPFDEEAVLSTSSLKPEEKLISMQSGDSVTPIEYVIALTKRLSYALAPNIDGKWLFGQLNLDQPLVPAGIIKIVQKSILHGRMSVNEIWLDDVMVGTIRFIVGKP
ncbi:hypothetical protein RTH46_19115 [Pseudomonas sp. zfem004]|uniref:hypothetical protein n=1 Tax=Pseudomonas sp. zfem004 TaxID=3078199 RepID=UPI0029297B3B|nr:hypothetical protein [Pseudomonas sp. zfem004]MDU9404598.1 hypothetical protein [Pseudomonas sp. zfem004]